MKTHRLKIHPEDFEAVISGANRTQVRKDDRNIKVGDRLQLQEWDPESEKYSGRVVDVEVTYAVRSSWGLPEGLVVLSIQKAAADTIVHPDGEVVISEDLEQELIQLGFDRCLASESGAKYAGTRHVVEDLWTDVDGQRYVTIDHCAEIPQQCCVVG